MKILIVEDDIRILGSIKKLLELEDYIVNTAQNAEEGLFLLETEDFDVIILDWMLPDLSGPEICEKIRAKKISTPVLMLTAKSQVEDKVEGLEVGADDYLTKPFASEELVARIKALIRRKSGKSQSPIIKILDLIIDTNKCEVSRKNTKIKLSPKEYLLLEYLARNKCKAIDRTEILSHVWGEEIDPFSNTVDVHIRFLRKKVDEPFKVKLITTVKNKGYMLCDQ